jgi:hypothetical protein
MCSNTPGTVLEAHVELLAEGAELITRISDNGTEDATGRDNGEQAVTGLRMAVVTGKRLAVVTAFSACRNAPRSTAARSPLAGSGRRG